MKTRPNILTIAGFDPSGGAGLLADIKTFESHRCLGFAVQTANTIQTENRFIAVNWIPDELILKQLDELLKQYQFKIVKIGLIPNLLFLQQALKRLVKSNPMVRIIWDPVLSVSAGFDFKHDLSNLEEILSRVDIITPNWNEITRMTNESEPLLAAKQLSHFCKIFLKGGHNSENLGKDFLVEKQEVRTFKPKPDAYYEKHGSGCVLSAAIASNILRGYPLQKSILKSKRYIEKVLKSNTTLLGYHYE